ncbi:uncharacterized protein LACBIDRAFT_318548 [Laccaria bicolor S238N-H82]|uniref:Predicted protein n=1 Tax=Laccaria bicolor (strain S238N-H82 / ATCC MYA-4686) TaxID=486041 RepID=B0E2M3_LACBS|nr:uncharacterized protein LACBIDRAFT_318548 [Laccaria bicolor S238N-H82]EDQ98903.1 predicted protein [Laccaria bicolor S238N-H82]|eukprot:XP_001890448.1 predicted protein [Laccaria bicolor S238N-H82]
MESGLQTEDVQLHGFCDCQPKSHVSFSHSHSLRRWTLLVAPLHRMLDSEKITTRNTVNRKVTATGFVRTTAVINPNDNITQLRTTRRHNGPSRLDGTKKLTWKKFSLGAALLVGVMWLCGPRAHTFSWRGNGNAGLEEEGYKTVTVPSPSKTHHQQTQQHHSSPAPKPPTTHPDSYETDSDPSSTTHYTHLSLLFRHSRTIYTALPQNTI